MHQYVYQFLLIFIPLDNPQEGLKNDIKIIDYYDDRKADRNTVLTSNQPSNQPSFTQLGNVTITYTATVATTDYWYFPL